MSSDDHIDVDEMRANGRLQDEDLEDARENAKIMLDIYATERQRHCAEDLLLALNEIEQLRDELENRSGTIQWRNTQDVLPKDVLEPGESALVVGYNGDIILPTLIEAPDDEPNYLIESGHAYKLPVSHDDIRFWIPISELDPDRSSENGATQQ